MNSLQLSRTVGRIGARYASREKRLDRTKWFKEGPDENAF